MTITLNARNEECRRCKPFLQRVTSAPDDFPRANQMHLRQCLKRKPQQSFGPLSVPYHIALSQLLFSSDDFIQAQQQLARWASEDVVSVVVLDPGTDSTGIGPSSTATIHGEQPSLGTSGLSIGARDYYPSPPSTETESSGSVIQPTQRLSQTAAQQRVGHLIDGQGDINGQPMENTGRYPEYKH